MPYLTLGKRPSSKEARAVATVTGGELHGLHLWADTSVTCNDPQMITLPIGSHFQYQPPLDGSRFVLFLGGAAGCGKSTLSKQIAELYHKMWPSRQQVLVSKLAKDEVLDSLPYLHRINIQSLVDRPFELNEADSSLIIVDDVEGLNPTQAAAVQNLVDIVLSQGRHSEGGTSLVYCSHNLTMGKNTRLLHMETHGHVIYPSASGFYQLRYLLTHYCAMSPAEVKWIRKLPSRWVCILKNFPPVCIWDSGAALINSLE